MPAFRVATLGLFAQMKDNRDKKLTRDNKWNNGQSHSCKVAEQTLPVLGNLSVDAGHIGGVSVLGWWCADSENIDCSPVPRVRLPTDTLVVIKRSLTFY